MTAIKVGPLRLYPSNLCKDPAYRALIAAAHPEAWWPMDDISGGVIDATGNGHFGSESHEAGFNYREPGPEGSPCSYAIEFIGEFFNTGLTIGASQHYAVIATVNADVLQGDRGIFATWNGVGTMAYLDSANNIVLFHNATSYDLSTALPVDTWDHIMYGWDGSNLKAWVGGTPKLNTGVGGGAGAGATAAFIGTYNGRVISTFDGWMNHVAVFLDGDADAILNDTDAAAFAAAALGL